MSRLKREQQQDYFRSVGAVQNPSQNAHPPQIPPPPPLSIPSTHNNRTLYGPESGLVDHFGFAANGNAYQHGTQDGNGASPIQYQSERSLSRKRSYDQREESSSEEGDSPRRQEDDITPKHKKRQPKVAAAYR